VGDDERRTTFHQPVETGLNRALGLGVHRTGGFVQNDDARILQYHARDGQALALAARQLDAAFPDLAFVLLRERLDVTGDVGEPGGFADAFQINPAAGEGNVLGDGAVEEESFLENNADGLAQGVEPHVLDGMVVDEDPALLGLVEAGEERHQGGFARAGGPDHCHPAAGGGGEGYVVQNRPVGMVAEGHVLKAHLAALELHLHRAGFFADFRRQVQEVEHPLGGGETALDHVVESDQLSDRVEEPAHQRHEGQHHAQGDVAPAEHDQHAAGDSDQQHGGIARAIENLVVQAEDAHGFVHQPRLFEIGAQVIAPGRAFALERLDFADTGDVFLDGRADDGILFAHLAVDRALEPSDAPDGPGDDGDGQQGEEEQRRTHSDHDQGHGDQVRGGVEQHIGIAQHGFHLFGVADHPSHDGAGAFRVEVGNGQAMQVTVNAVLHIEDDALAQAGTQAPHEHADGVGDHDQRQGDGEVARGPDQLRSVVGQEGAQVENAAEERKHTAAHHPVDEPGQAGSGYQVQYRVEKIEQVDREQLPPVRADEPGCSAQQPEVRPAGRLRDRGPAAGAPGAGAGAHAAAGIRRAHAVCPLRTSVVNGSRLSRRGLSSGW